jgi:hypothetical protein
MQSTLQFPASQLSATQSTAPESSATSGELSDPLPSVEDDLLDTLSSQVSDALSTASKSAHAKPRTAWVFKHMPNPDPETLYYTQEDNGECLYKNRVWKCKYCPESWGKAYRLNGGNTAIKAHLKSHGINEDSPRQERAKRQQSIIDTAQKEGLIHPQKRRRLNDHPGTDIDGDTLEILYVRFITACNEPVRLVECQQFRDLLYYLNKQVDNWLPASHNIIREWVLRQYKLKKDIQIQRLQSALSNIHIMADLWSSPNQLPVLGITAAYVCEDGKLETAVLALKVVEGTHDGENLSKYVMEVIIEWGIASKLGYFNMDNAPNNDAMLRHISISTLLCHSY